jgi:enoyl-CoA hydratase/carnithine racemase
VPAPLVRYAARDGIATLELNHPPANTYTHELMRELDEAVLRARFDRDVHVLVLRGAGERFFCGGADLRMLRHADPDFKYHFRLHASETLVRLGQTPKLVIAALNGHTVGGGLEIALAADLRVARRGGGRIGLPEVKLGILPGTGGSQRLARIVGTARAIEIMATGKLMEFERAQELGLVQRLFDAEGFDETVRDYATQFVPPRGASRAVGLIKRSVQSGAGMSLADALSYERELQQLLFLGEDAAEGLQAFLDKRDAEFKGR